MTKYDSPTWVNGTSPAVSAANLQALTDTTEKTQVQMGEITLSESSWTPVSALEKVYKQTTTVTGATVTATSKIDIQINPSEAYILQFGNVVGMMVLNDNGTVTVYSYGAPLDWATFTFQCTVTETVPASS